LSFVFVSLFSFKYNKNISVYKRLQTITTESKCLFTE
jgi:hypothetical protein